MRFSKVLVTIVLLAGLALTGLLGCGIFTPDSVESDRAALVALYNSTGGPEWIYNENWLSDEPLGTWYRVTTNDVGRVTELFLVGNNLDGSIPPELGNLSNLEILFLRENQLTGSIPPELDRLPNLEFLSLRANQLTGSIPPELGNLSRLEVLWLGGNQLTGPIPPELGNLSNLEHLWIPDNRLTGELPLSLMRTDLDWLTYAGNAGLCMPRSASMQSWRRGIERVEGPNCPR